MNQSTGAKFWAVDLHTHTPASRDVNVKTYGATTAEEVVQAALDAHLDAIAITDHNTSLWCDDVAKAAEGTVLIVLPGVEISTSEGHLLAIWEQGTSSSVVSELLIRLGIKGTDQGKLDIAAEVGLAVAAKEVADSGGVAIAAHVDREKGLFDLKVAAHVKKTLLNQSLSAVEIVDPKTQSIVNGKVGNERILACVRGSDCTLPGKSFHLLSGIGSRRTWIKAATPDLIGIKHALKDPDLRIRLEESQTSSPHPVINSISVKGSFLNEEVLLSPDMNCFLGGTGAGKSLILESLRFVLDQQVDSQDFPAISDEVGARLEFGLGRTGVIRVVVSVDGDSYSIERAFIGDIPTSPVVRQLTGDSWTEINIHPADIITLAAFSQGEILEFSRQPVGRMSLLDSAIDFDELSTEEDKVLSDLRENSQVLLNQRLLVHRLEEAVTKEDTTKERVDELSALFNSEVVKQQEGWTKESTRLGRFARSLPTAEAVELDVPKAMTPAEISTNQDLFDKIEAERVKLDNAISDALISIENSTQAAITTTEGIKLEWDARHSTFKQLLDSELETVKDGASLKALRSQLEVLQEQLNEIRTKKSELEETEAPALDELVRARDELLERLKSIRDERRRLRRARAVELNSKMAGIVKLDVSKHPDPTKFREALEDLKRGSRVKESVLDAIASRIHPFRFVRCLLAGDIQSLVDEASGIDLSSLARILSNLEDRDSWADLLEAQICDMPDRLDIKFRKPDDGTYAAIEKLAHGQRCTAILVVLLADGVDPVVVDQPEDALHAPWIEEYLVERLRSLRGERQYIFATRSPGIVVGGDAEQIITMKATSGRGEIEATGSLERYDLNKLSLHHLEGGKIAFKRRSGKLEVSVES